MNKTTISAFFAVPLIAGGTAYSITANGVYHYDYKLVDEALIMDPVVNQAWNDAATSLYLDPLGFNGTVTSVDVPEVVPGDNLDQAVAAGEQDLIGAVEAQYNSGAISPTDPLWIFGYSQSAVVASLAEQQLADYGIPSSDLHFVLVGDSASGYGGFLNTFVDSLPPGSQQLATEMLADYGDGAVFGATTPDDLYPTDVYSLSGDGWANWDNGTNIAGMFTDHLEYLGLTPAEISSATLSSVEHLTHYFTIDSADINGSSALWETLMIALSVF
jgi:hypothetical protein